MIGIPEDIELTKEFKRLVQLFNNTEEKLYCPDYCNSYTDQRKILLKFEQELIMRGIL